jgi:hypothetical protein
MKSRAFVGATALVLLAVLSQSHRAAGGFIQRFPPRAVALYADVASIVPVGPSEYHQYRLSLEV